MGKGYRIVFACLLAVMCFSSMGNFALSKAFPSVFNSTSYLSGGTSSRITLAQVVADPLGTLQDAEALSAFEDKIGEEVGNCVPYHDGLLLAHAAMQRASIRESASLFSFDVYPTYYGSKQAYSSQSKSVVPIALPKNEIDVDMLTAVLGVYSDAVRGAPATKWVFYIPDSMDISVSNPTSDSTSDPATYQFYFDAISAGLPETADIIHAEIDDLEEFYRLRFRTDHHWNIDGAIEGYERVADALGIGRVDVGEKVIAAGDAFYGSYARLALCLDASDDGIEDVAYDVSGLDVSVNGKHVDSTVLAYSTVGVYEKRYLVENLYAKCFHGDYALIEIANDDVDDGTLLIIGDSYTSPVERFLATGYHKVVVYDPRKEGAPSLSDVMGIYKPDAVVAIQMATNFIDETWLTGIAVGQ